MKAFGLKSTRPVYFDTIIAVYSLDGMSTNVRDKDFLEDRERLPREALNLLFFIKFKTSATLGKLLSSLGKFFKHFPKLRTLVLFCCPERRTHEARLKNFRSPLHIQRQEIFRSLIYSAVDVIVAPSLQENLP